jgi:hypothetical protein
VSAYCTQGQMVSTLQAVCKILLETVVY